MLQEARNLATEMDVEGMETLIAVLADDTTIIGELRTVVHLFLLIQKLAKERYNLDFHRSKCIAYSPSRTAEVLRSELASAQEEIIAKDPSLTDFAFISSCHSEGIAIMEGSGGFRSLGGPIGSDSYKLQYIRDTWEKTKADWQAFKNMHSSAKWRMDVLLYCLRARFNHLFRCIEPWVTLQIAAKLDQWFFSQACSIAGHDWDPRDKLKKAQFMSSRRHGGSSMILFQHLATVAYVSSWMDCLFPEGVAQNGVRPDGSKSIAEMHPFFNCLGMKDRVRQVQSEVPYANLSNRQRLVKWAEATRLFSFDEIPSDDTRFASLNQLRESCEALFEVPEIRRACFENQVAYNAINGESCRMHSQVGIPLPVRDQLVAEDGCQLLNFHQHSSFLPLPKHDRNESQRFRHNSLPVTTAYAEASLIDGPEVGLLEAKRAYKKLQLASLVWLMGRHFVRPNSEEEELQLALASEIDTAPSGL